MNFARVAAAAVAAWVVSMPVGYLLNEVLLKGIYVANAAAMRPEAEMQGNVPIGFVGMLVGFFAFAYMFAKGYEGTNGMLEGIRFGVLVAVLLSTFAFVWQYVVYPIGGGMTAAMIVASIVEMAIYGAVVGLVYRPAPKPAARPAAL